MPIPLEAAIQSLNRVLEKSDGFRALSPAEQQELQFVLIRMLFIAAHKKFEPTASSYHLAQKGNTFVPKIPDNLSRLISLIGSASFSGSTELWLTIFQQLESALHKLEHPDRAIYSPKKVVRQPRDTPRGIGRVSDGLDKRNGQGYVLKRYGRGHGPDDDGDKFGDERDP